MSVPRLKTVPGGDLDPPWTTPSPPQHSASAWESRVSWLELIVTDDVGPGVGCGVGLDEEDLEKDGVAWGE